MVILARTPASNDWVLPKMTKAGMRRWDWLVDGDQQGRHEVVQVDIRAGMNPDTEQNDKAAASSTLTRISPVQL